MSTPTPVTQLKNTTDVTDDQSQLSQISVASSSYLPQPVCLQASSPHHFAPARDLQQVGTVAMRDPSRHLSDPGPSHQFLYGASHFQLQQQHFSSTLSNLQPSAAATPSPNICNQHLSQRQPAGTNPHFGFGAPYVSQQATQGSWHSGHSPYRYELIELPSKAKKCYGCGLEFTEKFRQPPHNIVVKHVDRRLVRRDEQMGQFHYSADFSNTYYHLDSNHIACKNPVFDGNVYLSMATYQALDAGQHHVISTSNIVLI